MKKKIILYSLLVILIIMVISSVVDSYKNIVVQNIEQLTEQAFFSDSPDSYNSYVNRFNATLSDQEVAIDVFNDINEDESILDSFHLIDEGIIVDDEGKVTFNVVVPKTGFYNIELVYQQVLELTVDGVTYKGKGSEIERTILIDGEIPFNEAETVKFGRAWEDDYDGGNFVTNYNGDEVRPRQIEKVKDIFTYVQDYERRIIEPYKFYLTEGSHEISFVSLREPMVMRSITLKAMPEVKTYEEQLTDWKNAGLSVIEDAMIWHEAEKIYEKSTPVLIPLSDATSPKTYPYNSGKTQKLNVVGIYSWRLPGYFLSYKIDVPEEGLYQLTIRGKQDIKQSAFVSREILINGEVPFKEASYIPLEHSTKLNNYSLGTKDNPYLFHLKKGENIVEFKISLGNVGELIEEVKHVIDDLNDLYLNVIGYTTVSPSPNRDYEIEKQFPTLKEDLLRNQLKLIEIVEAYEKINKGRSGQISSLKNIIRQIDGFNKNIENIVYQLTSFQSNISALGTWILNEQEQPFTMDAFIFHSPGTKIKRARDNIFESLWQNVTKLVYSFGSSNALRSGKDGEQITVWVMSGRDNAQILRRIIDESFTENINVNLELVPREALLRAVLSGQGPDVALMALEGTPIDFASRGAVVDLTQFDDYDEVAVNFYDSAIEPFKLKNGNHEGVYALPEQQTFPVMFYRKDIFDKHSLTPPTTWTELNNVLNELNNENLDFYLESGSKGLTGSVDSGISSGVNTGLYDTFLYQYGGEFYNEKRSESALNSEEAMLAFEEFTKYFTLNNIPIQADFVNRFRSGEVAAGITDYQIYNTLVVFAPEISGKWGIAPVPTLEGGLDYVASKANSASMILDSTKNKEASWKFLKWWLSTETQVEYAKELETIMGAAARYTTANKEALEQLSWPTRDLNIILSMMEKSKGVPQVPGGYMTTRQFTYAFLNVVNESRKPRETLNEYIFDINKEIEKKRKEFNIK